MTSSSVIRPLHQAETVSGIRKVFVRDLVLLALIGVHRHEKDGRQRVRVNLEMDVVEGEQKIQDRLTDVVCYEEVVASVREIATEGHINLVETLAEEIAGRCLINHRVKAVRVRVEKLDVFADAASVGVEIERINSM